MGCGGSSTFNEDGSVIAGKGDTKIEWCAEKPVEVGFYYYSDKEAKILVKEFPMDKECVEKVFNGDNVVSSNGGMHWIKVVPGTRYAMKYTEGGHPTGFPGQKALEIPSKVHEHHTKDAETKDKLVADLKKDVEMVKEHPYNADGSDDKIKADIDSLANLQSTADIPDDMKIFKKACMSVEDLQPWSTINPVLDVKTEYGHWEEKDGKLTRAMGLADKAKAAAEEQVALKGPQVPHAAMSKVQEVFQKVLDGAVKGGCKKAGPEAEVLAPGLAARIDAMDGCVPGVARAAERKLPDEAEAKEEKKEEEAGDEDPVEKAAKAEYEADKGKLSNLQAEDGKDFKSDAESYLKATYTSISTVDPAAADKDTAVIANTQGFQAPAFVSGVEGDDVSVTYAANNFQDESDAKIPKQVDGSDIEGTTAKDSKIDAFTSLPVASDEWLERGQAVTLRKGREFSTAWVKSVDGDIVHAVDQFMVPVKADKKDVFTHLTQQQIATHGLALMPNFAPMKFWWIAAEDPNVTVRKVKVWRFGAPESAETFDLKAVRAPAKPTEAVKEPKGDVHIGYSAEVPILLGAKYAYNFQIGETWMVDFEKPVENDKGCKVFTCQARVEY